MVKVTIDGVEVEVEPGTNVIEAAFKAGVTIPHFCYHSKLSVAGNCRMCLVQVEGARKPDIACNTQVRDGMVVHASGDRIEKLRKGVLEFLFLNHPLDCPICDKAGECKLQDYYLEHGQYISRLDEGKVRKPKRLDIGTHVVLDTERCVLCSRCVRFCDEITGTGELRIFERGSHAQVGIYPGKRLENRYSLCTTDVCPVGALTGKEFRFQDRVWYLKKVPSVCGGCATGCNIEVHHHRNEVQRFMPRRNDYVNDTWMCDEGRLGYKDLQAVNRLESATFKGSPTGKALQETLGELEGALQPFVKDESDTLGFVLSPLATLEENFLIAKMAAAVGGQLFLVGGNAVGADDDDDGFLIRSDKNPNTRGAQLLAAQYGAGNPGALLKALDKGSLKGLFVINNDVIGKAQSAGVETDAFGRLGLMVVMSPQVNPTVEAAHFGLPIGTYLESDGSFVNREGRIQRLQTVVNPPAEARSGWEVLAKVATILNISLEMKSAEAIFAAMAAEVEALRGMSYALIGGGGIAMPDSKATAA